MSATERGMWDRVRGIVGATAPVLGGLLGGPGGSKIGSMLAAALGVTNNPSAIEKALQVDPAAAVKLAELESNVEAIRIQAEADTQMAIEATHQAALQQSDLVTKRTRPRIARQSWAASLAYALITIFGTMLDPFITQDLSTLAFDPVIFGTLAGPALWYMGMRGLEKYKHGNQL
jgi:hypothetical protein